MNIPKGVRSPHSFFHFLNYFSTKIARFFKKNVNFANYLSYFSYDEPPLRLSGVFEMSVYL